MNIMKLIKDIVDRNRSRTKKHQRKLREIEFIDNGKRCSATVIGVRGLMLLIQNGNRLELIGEHRATSRLEFWDIWSQYSIMQPRIVWEIDRAPFKPPVESE